MWHSICMNESGSTSGREEEEDVSNRFFPFQGADQSWPRKNKDQSELGLELAT